MNPKNRATVVVKVGGREVARRQVRLGDGDTVELDVPTRDVFPAVRDEIVADVRRTKAQFRATGGK